MSKVLIMDVGDSLPEVIDHAFREFSVDLRGKKVLVKPNLVAALQPGSCTSPQVIEAIVLRALAQGAEVIVGDGISEFVKNSANSARIAGIFDACHGCFRKIGAELKEVPANSAYAETFLIPKAILECDFLINVPRFKNHNFMTITGAIKNVFGYIPGGCKAGLHLKAPSRRRLSELVCDVYRIRPPNLHIMDGFTAMQGNGPTRGDLRPLGKVLASTDPLALDSVVAMMMGLDPSQVLLLVTALERGLGVMDMSQIEVIGDAPILPNFKMGVIPPIPAEEAVHAIQTLSSTPPDLLEGKCNLCGECINLCPRDIISINGALKIELDKCIACYACVEGCPEEALQVPAGLLKLWERMNTVEPGKP